MLLRYFVCQIICEQLKNKARVLKSELETAASKHEKEKQKWLQICDNLERSLARIPEETATRAIAEEKAHMKVSSH